MPDFTDASLTPRARYLALWLCDLANPALSRRDKDASASLLLRELPDHWTAEEIERAAHEIRGHVGPRASHREWLTAIGWLVGEEERLPERSPLPLASATRFRVRDLLARALRDMGAPA